jgi:hypothetical protein
MKTISKVISVVALTIFSLNANAQEVRTVDSKNSVIKTESKIDKPDSKHFKNRTQKRKTKPMNRVPIQRTTIKEVPVKE